MKSVKWLLCVFFVLFLVPFSQAAEATFDDLTLETESYWNGSDESGGFVSGDAWFGNNYDSTYYSWDGFSYSNMTDTTTAGYSNQYSAYTGTGVNGSTNYAVAFFSEWAGTSPTVSLGAVTGEDYNTTITGAYFTNTTYAALSMLNGDSYAKQFGGEDGTDEDWFLLTIKGIDEEGSYTGEVEFYLADYRFEDDSLDYIVDEWTWVDLTSLGDVIGLEFSLSSSDNGDWGMNTPAYFAMDSLNAVPVPAAVWLFGSGLLALVGIRKRRG